MAIEFAPWERSIFGATEEKILPFRETTVEHIVEMERPVSFGFLCLSRTITRESKYQKGGASGLPVPER